MSSLGTWEPEAADLRAEVLTNGFETCLRSHRTSPWLRGSSQPGCLCFGGLLPPPLFSPPPSTLGCGLQAVAWLEVTWGGLRSSGTVGTWQPTIEMPCPGAKNVAPFLLLLLLLCPLLPSPSSSSFPFPIPLGHTPGRGQATSSGIGNPAVSPTGSAW